MKNNIFILEMDIACDLSNSMNYKAVKNHFNKKQKNGFCRDRS